MEEKPATPADGQTGSGATADDAKEASAQQSQEPSRENSSQDRGARYHRRVLEKVLANAASRQDVNKWPADHGIDLKAHGPAVFAAAGVLDPQVRISQVEAAVMRQQQLLMERKARKKERMRDAVRGANKQVPEDGEHHGEEKGATKSETLGDKLIHAVEAMHEKEEEKWHEVQSFKTREEAIGFIMECQPFSYQPDIEKGDDPFPRFENSRDAVAHILQMIPIPKTYTSTVAEFKRRLRIRLQHVDQQEDEKHSRKLLQNRGRRRSAHNAGAVAAPAHKVTVDPKPWLVETTGTFFESPASLRDLKEAGTKYFIAVAQDTAPIVLQEGYRVKQRSSVPCSGTQAEALEAFDRNEKKAGRKTKAVALPVTLPPEMDVVTHRNGGFLIRAKELPPSCFRVKKAGPAGGDGV